MATVSVSLATGAWLSLLFFGGSNRRRCWHQLKQCEGSPRFFPWNPDEGSGNGADASAVDPFQQTAAPGGVGGRDDGGRKPEEEEQLLLRHIMFGITGSTQLWSKMKQFVRRWWRPDEMIGHVWLEDELSAEKGLPPIKVSEDISD